VSLSLYMDEHVPAAITEGLRLRGVDVLTVQEDGRGGMDDGSVIDRATELGRLVFSRDRDMLQLAQDRQRRAVGFSGIIFAHQQRASIGRCVSDLELICMAGNAGEFASRVEFIPLT
jgi:hypothetical protein